MQKEIRFFKNFNIFFFFFHISLIISIKHSFSLCDINNQLRRFLRITYSQLHSETNKRIWPYKQEKIQNIESSFNELHNLHLPKWICTIIKIRFSRPTQTCHFQNNPHWHETRFSRPTQPTQPSNTFKIIMIIILAFNFQ